METDRRDPRPGTRLDRATRALRARWQELTALTLRTGKECLDDRVPGLAAELAFFGVLSLPPLLLVLLGAVGYVADLVGPETAARIEEELLDGAANFFTASTMDDVIRPALSDLLSRGRADILSLGIVITLWSSTRFVRVLIQSLTLAYDLEDHRSWWQRAGLAVGLTGAAVVAGSILLPLLVIGPQAGAGFAEQFGLAQAFEVTWATLYWPAVAAIGVTLLAWIYHVVPPHHTAWRRDLPGALLALGLWVLGSFALRVYAVEFIEADSAYSLFAAPLAVLLWVYVTSAAVLVGAELNAEIEKTWPDATAA